GGRSGHSHQAMFTTRLASSSPPVRRFAVEQCGVSPGTRRTLDVRLSNDLLGAVDENTDVTMTIAVGLAHATEVDISPLLGGVEHHLDALVSAVTTETRAPLLQLPLDGRRHDASF